MPTTAFIGSFIALLIGGLFGAYLQGRTEGPWKSRLRLLGVAYSILVALIGIGFGAHWRDWLMVAVAVGLLAYTGYDIHKRGLV